MKRRLLTPQEIAARAGGPKDKFTIYVEIEPMDYLKKKAIDSGNIAYSLLVNEAIKMYVAELKAGDKK